MPPEEVALALNHVLDNILSSILPFRDQNNPNLPVQSILLLLPALPPLPLLPPCAPPPSASICVYVFGLLGAITLTNCPPAQLQLNIIYGHCFSFIGLCLCLLITVTMLHVHCHISPPSLSPVTKARGDNRLFTVYHVLTATFLSSCQ